MGSRDGGIAAAVGKALDVAVGVGGDVVRLHVGRVRAAHPTEDPREILERLERHYLASVTMSGAAAGAVAAVPGIGMPGGIAAGSGDAAAFLSASGLFVLAYAEVHGVPVEDLERRKTLVMAVLLGDAGSAAVARVAERTGRYWGLRVAKGVPLEAIRRANRILGPNFVTRFGTTQGILVLGKAAPFGLGVLLGGAGNHGFGRLTVRAARQAFGPAPLSWFHGFPPASPSSLGGLGDGPVGGPNPQFAYPAAA